MRIKFIDDHGTFTLENPEGINYLYMPIANEAGVMGSITPDLSGDSKTDQETFLLEPVSNEDLHGGKGRNFWCRIEGKGLWSAAGKSAKQLAERFDDKKEHNTEQSELTAGKLWQKLTRVQTEYGIKAEITNFCPASNEKAEIMQVELTNIGKEHLEITPIAAIPIYGRSADNLRDHRHVTSLLNRIEVTEDGIKVKPTLSFDERGHRVNTNSYGVYGREDSGKAPAGFYPILQDFIGEGGSLLWPAAAVTGEIPYNKSMEEEGFEAMGGIEFETMILAPGSSKSYQIVLSYNEEGKKYLYKEEAEKAFSEMKAFWNRQSAISTETGDKQYDSWLGWVGIQPLLRRIYGCSFLPHHDYGRGGRGWRDLWQDSLALLLADQETERQAERQTNQQADKEDIEADLISYYGGVRMDGTNATIIGTKPGEFIADRNSIIRVWMDHGVWPLITTKIYIHQTGNLGILLKENTYFKDGTACRGRENDEKWDGTADTLAVENGKTYTGTILEHILIQHLTMFFDVGEHNFFRLHGADWNDALDMASENGESVAFTAAYAGNFQDISQLLLKLQEKGFHHIRIAEEAEILLAGGNKLYDSPECKQQLLEEYCQSCRSTVSGRTVEIALSDLADNLMEKADWLRCNIRKKEWVRDSEGNGWFNGYYDNDKKQVEGEFVKGARMILTSQVFAIMSGTALDEQVSQICKSADRYLYEESAGGYRLNTNFHEIKSNLGRMFGFAYGHKENGAVFSHMAVMYAYSLYSRGFVKEGYTAIHALYKQGMDFERSCMYPGIPEYYNVRGRGMYPYLTGAASWLIFTVLTEMFGVKGVYGDLLLQPKLLAEQFDHQGKAEISCSFANRNLKICYSNKQKKEIGDYEIMEIYIDGQIHKNRQNPFVIEKENIEQLSKEDRHIIHVILG